MGRGARRAGRGPAIRVVASEERHATIDRSLRPLGLGAGSLQPVPADGNGAIDVAALGNVLAGKPADPTIVSLQSGNVNTGACDDLAGAVAAAHGRGFATWAALRELGRSGVAELVDRCCTLARRFATQLGAVDGISVVNDVVLNQVLLRFGDDGAGHRGCAALGPVPDGLDDLAWPAANAHLGVELAYHRGGCRPVGTRDRCRGAPLIQARAAETGPALPGTPSDRYRAGKARGGDPAGHRDKEVALA